jgi:hypothetical protein
VNKKIDEVCAKLKDYLIVELYHSSNGNKTLLGNYSSEFSLRGYLESYVLNLEDEPNF